MKIYGGHPAVAAIFFGGDRPDMAGWLAQCEWPE